jgi:hypothetical protein
VERKREPSRPRPIGSRLAPLAPLVIAGTALAGACSGSTPPERAIVLSEAFPAHLSTPRDPGAAPAAAGQQACPADAPQACGDGCCPAKLSCGTSACDQPAKDPACPADAPVACTGLVDCSVSCVAHDSSGSGNDAVTAPPAALVEDGYLGGGLHGAATAPAVGFPIHNAGVQVDLWFRIPLAAPGTAWNVFTHGERIIQIGENFGLRATIAGSCGVLLGQNDGGWHHLSAGMHLPPTVNGKTAYLAVDANGTGCSVVGMNTMAGTPVSIGYAGIDVDEVVVKDANDATVAEWHFDEGSYDRCCPAGATCGPGGTCGGPGMAGVPPSCPEVDCGDGTCCPAGASCAAGGCQKPSSATPVCPLTAPVQCADGGCCPAGWSCDVSGCTEPLCPTDPACPKAEVPMQCQACGAGCCPAGASCNAGACETPKEALICHGLSTLSCGSPTQFCCPNTMRCGATGCEIRDPPRPAACPPEAPGYCVAGRACCAGACDPVAKVCHTPKSSPVGSFTGPPSGDGHCPAGYVSAGPGVCCPDAQPDLCGGRCYSKGFACPTGAEVGGCHDGETSCGEVCCGPGNTCQSGKCVPGCNAANFPTVCGDRCCGSDISCEHSACQCPAEHPVACGDFCCLPGAACLASPLEGLPCGCPGTRVPCALASAERVCCDEGMQCIAGKCAVPAPASSTGSSGGTGCSPLGGPCSPGDPNQVCCNVCPTIICGVNLATNQGHCKCE